MEPKKIIQFMIIAGVVALIAGAVTFKMMDSIDYSKKTTQNK